MNVLGIIPARYQSSRLPGKPLADIHGKTMIQRVYERAKLSLKNVVIATDDPRMKEAAENFGAAASQSVEDTMKELEEMRRQQASQIVVPGQGNGSQIQIP